MRKVMLAAAILVFSAMTVSAGEWTVSTEIGEAPIEALAAGPDGTAWAAMYSDNRIFHFDGASWSVHTVLTGWAGEFYTAFALNSGQVWMYGSFSPSGGGGKAAAQSVLAYFDGSNWQLFGTPMDSNSALYASGPNDLWLGGYGGLLHRSSNYGASWYAVTAAPQVSYFSGIAGTNPNSIWAAGGDMTGGIYLTHYNGITWTGYSVASIGSSPKVTIPGGPPVCSFAAPPFNAGAYEYRDGSWNQTTVIADDYPSSLSSDPGATDVWVGGDTGNLYNWNGTAWSVSTTFGESVWNVSGRGGNVWVSTEGRIYRRRSRRNPRGDFSGDGTSDIGVFRPASGLWAVRSVTRTYFGSSSDQPVARDYRGDGTADVAVFRPATGLWAVRGVTRTYFGGSGDTPVSGDYRGDGSSDAAIFRPATGLWAVRQYTRAYFGGPGDIPVPGDYRGDGSSDAAIFRPATGLWAVRGVTRVYFGGYGDNPVSGDYRGDGTSDIAVFRPSTGLWAVRGVTRTYFGGSNDRPATGDYSGDGTEDVAVFRPASGLWAIRGLTRVYYGTAGDLPAAR